MQLLFWIAVFIVSLFVLIKAADYFTNCSEKIGLALKISPFIIGITIVSIGTSLPELATSIVAIFNGQTEIVVANVIGSNITNILLIIGLATLAARVLVVERSLIDLDLPLLAAATTLLIVVIWDRQVTAPEGALLFIGYFVYLAYTVSTRKKEVKREKEEVATETKELKKELTEKEEDKKRKAGLSLNVIIILIVSGLFIYFGASYTVQSLIKIAEILSISPSIVAMTAVALGTSLPELVVSIRAVLKKKYEIAIGNIFGSNIFNILVVTSVPSFFKTLSVDITTFTIGIPFIIGVTILFIFSGISKKIHNWEGIFYLLIYVLFIVKLFGLF